jgi:hypothetical protein
MNIDLPDHSSCHNLPRISLQFFFGINAISRNTNFSLTLYLWALFIVNNSVFITHHEYRIIYSFHHYTTYLQYILLYFASLPRAKQREQQAAIPSTGKHREAPQEV